MPIPIIEAVIAEIQDPRKPYICGPCAMGDHSTHDGDGGRIPAFGFGLDAYDCKTQPEDDRAKQCMCRATWPKEML